jgi:predicted glycogen debranching enzyme
MKNFVIHRGNSIGLLRGLPWHGEWSRHAMMALPGLLALERFTEAQGVLSTWAARAKNGLLPRYIDDHGLEGEGDVEGTLWFSQAVDTYLAYTKNHEWVKANVLGFMNESLGAIAGGKSAAARVGDDGMIYTSGQARALSPRDGYSAFTEIQALYFNALRVMESISTHWRDDESARKWQLAAKAVQKAFNKNLWDTYNHVPVDSFAEGNVDRTPRPMCLWAVALSHPVLIRRRWELLVQEIESALLTPRGLLAVPQDFPGSRKFFPGDSYEVARSAGGIWPEFLGAFLVAYAKAFGKSALKNEKIEDYLKRMCDSLSGGMLHHVAEFFDSVEPFTPRGAPANAAAAGQLVWALTAKVDPRSYGGEE